MTPQHSSPPLPRLVLVDWVSQQTDFSTAIRLASVLFVATLTGIGAQVSVPLPMTPVPFTIQPMIVLLGGAALGPRLGAMAQLIYLAAGAAGLPVFAVSPVLPNGLWRLLGPTGGYLLSYPLAAAVTGYFAARGLDRRYPTQVAAMAAGLLVLFAGGVARLAYGPPTPLELSGALAAGFYPFILADLAKVSVAAVLLPTFWRFLGPTEHGR